MGPLSAAALVTLALAAGPAATRPHLFPGATSVLWIGAHPDDEVFAAPLLGRLCRDEGLACRLLVLTRGEEGPCRLPGGCGDLAALRVREARASAALLGAGLTVWSLPDGGAGSPDACGGGWDAARGSHAALVQAVARFVDRSGADLVLTFDPAHGTTGHLDHRATGSVVLAALGLLRDPPTVRLIATRLVEKPPPQRLGFVPGAGFAAGVWAFDATAPLGATGEPSWDLVRRVMAAHASQFDAATRRAAASVPAAERAVWLEPPPPTPPAGGCGP